MSVRFKVYRGVEFAGVWGLQRFRSMRFLSLRSASSISGSFWKFRLGDGLKLAIETLALEQVSRVVLDVRIPLF